ncbi:MULTISPECIES: EamA family transporter [unclassified Microbacterium]|uniref:EamA family transporter n=1 Tax=unclassified Microbacterium TaxID=2609290 RepID=UPI000EA975DF|nr:MULTISPECIES: EamA family transporter [unclassified Microbacterium]MBT2485703.1 EamA family transporter [Microbacterium sp. ISL-108]RKN68477.1 EamA family transporter [Microbacterium sp. CGR2]
MERLATILLTALAPIAWGTTYLVTTEMLPPGHPLFAGLVRALPAGLLAVVIGGRLPRGTWWWRILVLGALNIGAFFPLLFLAAERLPGGVAAAVAGAQPLIVLILGALVLRERIRPLSAAAAVAGAGGVALVVLGPAARLDALGLLAALGGVTATGVGMILTKQWGRPVGVGPIAYAGWQLTAGGVLLLPVTLTVEGVPSTVDGAAILGYLWLGTVGGIVAYTLWFRGIQRLPVIAPGLLALLSPIVATTLGALVVGEAFTPTQSIGFGIAVTALVLGQIVARPERRMTTVPTRAVGTDADLAAASRTQFLPKSF